MREEDALPIQAVLGALNAALANGRNAVLIAPPGAGKTTRVPLELLAAPWRGNGKILVLEPRRLAARNAAERMAKTLNEQVGARVGLRAPACLQGWSRDRHRGHHRGCFHPHDYR